VWIIRRPKADKETTTWKNRKATKLSRMGKNGSATISTMSNTSQSEATTKREGGLVTYYPIEDVNMLQ
jgi:hypothetical protein